MINILYYGYVIIDAHSRFYISTAIFNLKTYIETHHADLSKNLNWIVQQEILDNESLIKLCNDKNIDILATSHYIWNHYDIMKQLEAVKKYLPKKTKLVAGGPSISVNIDKDFFNKFSFIDYAIYGPGEIAFSDIISSIFNKTKLIAFNTSNLAWYDKSKSKTIISSYKYVPVLQKSIYIQNKKLFSSIVQDLQKKGHDIVIPFELTRGCPYSCTFCDWNSGLSNKVSRRKIDYKQDIDLFQELNIRRVYLTDANLGQYDEDIEVVEYFARKNIEEKAQFIIEGNLSKLKKENNRKIFKLFASANLVNRCGLLMGVQDTNREVLQNSDRPDVSWNEHRKIIKDLVESYPNYFTKLQLVQGLPGQTVKSWIQTLDEVTEERVLLIIFVNEYLAASPAALDKNYQDKWKYEYSQSLRLQGRKNLYFRGNMTESSTTFSQKDFAEMTVLSHLYGTLQLIKCGLSDWQSFSTKEIAHEFINTDWFRNCVNTLYENWSNLDKFYWTAKQVAFNEEIDNHSACDIPNRMFILNKDFWSFVFTKTTTSKIISKQIYKLYLQSMKTYAYGMQNYYSKKDLQNDYSIEKLGVNYFLWNYY